MPFRWSATDPAASDIGSVYDVGIATRDGSSIVVLDRNLKQVSVSQMAYMCSRDATLKAFKEATELQEKAKLVQLGTATAIDREFDQWVQNTQGDWSGGIGQRVYGQQGIFNQYFDGEGLLWPLNDWVPQIALRGPTQPLPSAGIVGPTGADSAIETVAPGGALTTSSIAAVLASFKASGGAPALVGVKGPLTTGTNIAVAPTFGQATTLGDFLTCKVTGQRQQLGGSANIGDTGAATFSFDFSGVSSDNIIGTNDTFAVPAGGIYVNSITCYMGGHTANVNTIFAIWNANTGALLVSSSNTNLGTGRASRTLNVTQTFIAAGTSIRVGFWRQQNQDAEWGVASSGSFLFNTNDGSVDMPSNACSSPYVCGNPQMYATYQQLTVSEIAQSNPGPAPGWSLIKQQNSPDGFQSVQIWAKPNCLAGETAPAFAAAQGASPMDAQLEEWTHVATASPTDSTGGANNANQNALTVTNAAQDVVAGNLVIFAARVVLSGAGTAAFGETMNNGVTAIHLGDTGASSRQQHSSFAYGIIPTGVAQFGAWAVNGTTGGFIDGLGMGYAITYLDTQGTPHWHAAFFSGDQGFDVDLGANTGNRQGPLHMDIAGGYLWILFSENPNTAQLSVRMLGCVYGSNTFTQLRNDLITPLAAGSSGFSGVIAASYVGGHLYVAFLQADQDLPPGAPSANRNALYVLDYSAGTGTAPSGITAPAFVFPFTRGFKALDLTWQGNNLVCAIGDGMNAWIYQLVAPFSTINTESVIEGIANAYLCNVGSTLFIVGWTAGPAGSGINRMDLYTLDGSTLTEIPFSPIVPFLDSVTSPTSFGGYAFWAVSYPTPGGVANQKTVTVYAYDVVRSRLFRCLTFTTPSWTGSDIFGHDVIAVYGVTSRTQAAGATFQSQLGLTIFSGFLSGNVETAREFYWGVIPLTPAPAFTGLLQMGVDITSGLFDFTAATNKLFRAVLSHFIDGLIAGTSSPDLRLRVWFDQDPNRLAAAPDFTATTAPSPNPLPTQLDLNLFSNRVARKLVYEIISEGGGFNGAAGWQNAPKLTDIIVQASTGWVWDFIFDLAPGAATNTGERDAYHKQSDPTTNQTLDQVVAYNWLRQLWRQKGGECIIYLPNGDTYNALIQLEEFEGPKPFAVSARADQQTTWQELVSVKIREDI